MICIIYHILHVSIFDIMETWFSDKPNDMLILITKCILFRFNLFQRSLHMKAVGTEWLIREKNATVARLRSVPRTRAVKHDCVDSKPRPNAQWVSLAVKTARYFFVFPLFSFKTVRLYLFKVAKCNSSWQPHEKMK